MRLAIVSDVHGNLVALEAVLADLERHAPDVVVHGGDLALFGPEPDAVVDRLRELGWEGVLGNTDELLWKVPAAADEATLRSIEWTRTRLGESGMRWLRQLPLQWRRGDEIALVHAAPDDVWRAVPRDAPDSDLKAVYGPLGARVAAYCHIHTPFVRELDELTVANGGSVSIPLDGDPRPSYLLIDGGRPEPVRVDFDLELAVDAVRRSDHPAAEWIERRMRRASP